MNIWKNQPICVLNLVVMLALFVISINGAAVTPSNLTLLAKITGAGSINQTDLNYRVMGTDLGIMWDNGQGQIMAAFGDTYGQGWGGAGAGPRTADWRCNVLALSTDRNPDDGLNFDTMIQDPSTPGRAKQLLGCKQINSDEETVIPTAGTTVGTRHYIHYMSVNHWGTGGSWYTNYSGIAYSDDNGQNWIKDQNTRWVNDSTWSNRFQMAAFVKNGGYVYLFGTPNGRFGNAYLARVPENSVLNKSAYQYWNGTAWQTNNEAAAAPIVIAPVGELSLQYNSNFGRWVMTYLDEKRAAIILRDSLSLTGPWTGQKILVKGSDYPALYGGHIHPWFNDSNKLYFTMSQWQPYNVFFMRAQLDMSALGENILSDPGFEEQTSNSVSAPWAKGGDGAIGIDRGLGFAHSGSNNGYLRATSGFQNIYQDVAVISNHNYRLSAWVKTSPALVEGFLGVRSTSDGPPLAEVKYGSSVGTPSGVYMQKTLDFNSGGQTSLRVYVGMFGPGSDAFMQLDDLVFNQL